MFRIPGFRVTRNRLLALAGAVVTVAAMITPIATATTPAFADAGWSHFYLKETSGSYKVGASILVSGADVEETIGGRFTSASDPSGPGSNCFYLGNPCVFISLDASNGTLCLVDDGSGDIVLGGCHATGSVWAITYAPDGDHMKFLNRHADQQGANAQLTGFNDGTLFFDEANNCTNSCYQKFKLTSS